MKKFQFPLDKVLSLRVFLEKQAEVVLQRAVGRRDMVKLKIEDIESKMLEYSLLFSLPDVEMNTLSFLEDYMKGLKVKKLLLQQELLTLEKEVNVCLSKYNEALRDRKILDRLKEKGVEEWKEMLEKEEILIIDEVISAKISKQS